MRYTLHHGDNREVLRTMPDNSVDSIVTDPPYELGFMGKKWDSTGIAYDTTLWAECLRVLKPGGHLIAFGGTRTYHRMTCAIEDVGFEIRDCIQWIYGSGFPKSLDVSKAIDKQAGAEREVVGRYETHDIRNAGIMDKKGALTVTATPEAQQWHGFGTAAKPAHEPAVLAYKPHDGEHGIIIANLEKLEAQLWLMWFASTADWSSTSSQHGLSVALSIAQWTADEIMRTRDDLCGQTDMLQFAEVMTSCLNIVTSWKSTWVEASKHGNTFITKTVLSPIIGWTTLKSSLYQVTPNFITKAVMQHDGTWQHVLSAATPFIVASQKLKSTLELIAVEHAISKTYNPASLDSTTANEPAVLARKPLSGTVADNVLTWGCGALNIDGCRVGDSGGTQWTSDGAKGDEGQFGGGIKDGKIASINAGRWPANVIFDEEAAQMLDAQSGNSTSVASIRKKAGKSVGNKMTLNNYQMNVDNFGGHSDSGGASRFFYVAKASKAEREAGLDGDSERANHHPTVKPITLMRYLVRLVTPPGGVVLDPFMGSGSTGCAAMLEAMQFIGIELSAEYLEIARRRIEFHEYTVREKNPMGL
jgi:DNA modification methylase